MYSHFLSINNKSIAFCCLFFVTFDSKQLQSPTLPFLSTFSRNSLHLSKVFTPPPPFIIHKWNVGTLSTVDPVRALPPLCHAKTVSLTWTIPPYPVQVLASPGHPLAVVVVLALPQDHTTVSPVQSSWVVEAALFSARQTMTPSCDL